MATGIMQRFKGRVMCAVLYLGSGGIVDAASGVAGKAQLAARIPIAVTATANTDIVASLPPGATILSASVYTTTAFTGNTVTLQIGSTTTASDIVAATSIKGAGFVLLVVAANAPVATAVLGATPNVFVRVIQTATTTNVGAATLVIEYVMP